MPSSAHSSEIIKREVSTAGNMEVAVAVKRHCCAMFERQGLGSARQVVMT